MHLKDTKNKLGFTLVELLVVISIIGLLSTLAIVALNNARAKARDAKRKADLRQIQKAFDLYYDKYDRFPPEGLCWDTSVGSGGCVLPTPLQDYWDPNSDLQDLVTEGFMGRVPVDPLNNGSYYYNYEPDQIGQGTPPCTVSCCRYTLWATLEGGGTFTVKGGDVAQ
ncbi:type II secretion system GspH family protein [Patescibacteria group bacterium]|nr:type II secretion system GspH family protein [Patescibacteria group bacterium]